MGLSCLTATSVEHYVTVSTNSPRCTTSLPTWKRILPPLAVSVERLVLLHSLPILFTPESEPTDIRRLEPTLCILRSLFPLRPSLDLEKPGILWTTVLRASPPLAASERNYALHHFIGAAVKITAISMAFELRIDGQTLPLCWLCHCYPLI